MKEQNQSSDKTIVVIGGGLSGLISSILIRRAGIQVTLIEKKQYPFHRVCGEYISKEVIPFLKNHDLYPEELGLSDISKFELSSISGKLKKIDLPLGGFGISRYSFDLFLYEKAKALGIEFIYDQVTNVKFKNDQFSIELKSNESINTSLVIGAHGKRSVIDKKLNRSFISKSSPYIGVKYHIKYDFPVDTVALHNFYGGYCGINAVEDNKFNLCYLSHRDNLKAYKDIPTMEKNVLQKNPHLNRIMNEAEHLFDKPEVINEISFETKGPIENHILMCGDAAGMITPLCGNGMAMAIRSSKIAAEKAIDYLKNHQSRNIFERDYRKSWNTEFKFRLAVGRNIQKLFGKGFLSGFAVGLLGNAFIAQKIIRMTHGEPFN